MKLPYDAVDLKGTEALEADGGCSSKRSSYRGYYGGVCNPVVVCPSPGYVTPVPLPTPVETEPETVVETEPETVVEPEPVVVQPSVGCGGGCVAPYCSAYRSGISGGCGIRIRFC
ncbi:MAG: hypothetical protein LBR25_08420 [Erysipelotrichaceae bacterium]|jgi:hypothetical protein|nr:hypothetical protein [Erysipelotrichaceae bacterium]